jgi:hypothetical protein
MATVNLTSGTAAGKAPSALNSKSARLIYRYVDLAKAVTAKGSALAQNDVITAIQLPPGTWCIRAGAKVVEVAKDANGTAIGTMHFGVGTLGDAGRFVTRAVGDFATATYQTDGYANTYTFNTGTDSINVVIDTYTGTTTTQGAAVVWALVADLAEFPGSNIDATTNIVGVPQA